MAFPTAVNDQITDAVTQANLSVLGQSPAMGLASAYQTMAHAAGLMFHNAVAAQQQQNMLSQAAAVQAVMQIYSVDTAAGRTDTAR